MITSIEQYLAELKTEFAGSDRATVQDALSDAEEYLRTALDTALKSEARNSEAEVLASIIEKYGSPKEIAAAYKEIESRTPPAFGRTAYREIKPPAPPAPPLPPPVAAIRAVPDTRNIFARFFGVFAEARTWGSFLYLMLAMFIGIAYFTWAVTGISVSLGLLVIIVGIPTAGLFLLSVRGIALIEGRLVEALTGVRMPRRSLFARKDVSFWQKVKSLFADRLTWTGIIYMLLQMPLGIIYFTVFVTLIAVSVGLVLRPIFELAFGFPMYIVGEYGYFTPYWLMPFSVIGGVLLLTATMHLVKLTGRLHGHYAKAMLVRGE
jgi:uncharacterized membrane protein